VPKFLRGVAARHHAAPEAPLAARPDLLERCQSMPQIGLKRNVEGFASWKHIG
jgi:hypothetical protein